MDICTILFSDVVGFTTICSAISPMQVVSMLNGMYTTFDTLIEKHHLYKVFPPLILGLYIVLTSLSVHGVASPIGR